MGLSRSQLRFVRALAAILAVIASFCSVAAIGHWTGARMSPAILAATVAIGLSRRPIPAHRMPVATVPLGAACIAVAGAGVGRLLQTNFTAGALVFSAALGLSIWLRNFGENAKTAGALIALPFIGMLIVPARADAPGGPLVDLAIIFAAGVVPFGYVTGIGWLAKRFGVRLFAAAPQDAEPAQRTRSGISVPTRMAVQMLVALLAAFGLGSALFPEHWSWVVLTAFIVCSGARGRGDAAYKGVLRLTGAVGGTLGSALIAHWAMPGGVPEAATIFAILFVGLWLRDVSYAYWAGCVTLVLALLSGTTAGATVGFLGTRLEAILAGALCGVAAAWFVLPIRTQAVVRRRIADALRALDELVARDGLHDPGHAAAIALLEHRLTELDRVAPPVVWHRRIFARDADLEHPGRWIELVHRLAEHAALVRDDARGAQRRGAIRRAIGISRRAVADHGKPHAPPDGISVGAALTKLHDTLAHDTG